MNIPGVLAAIALVVVPVLARADWPTARGDGGRTGASAAGPAGPLVPGWVVNSGTPSPAWAGEARGSLWQKITNSLTARAADDIAPVPIIAGGRVVFATTLDEVRCLDLPSGRLLWRHFCGGPIRYAPAIHGDRVFVGADDGLVRALDLASGRELWSVGIGPAQPWISGNGRPISPFPIRTGLLVTDGTVYVAAGLFPLEGTFLAALEARDGTVRWRRSLGNESPQGYLVDAGADVLVPQGRASPRLYRKQDGTPGRVVTSASGTFAVVSEGETLAGPGATGSIEAAQAGSGAKIVSYPGRQMAVTRDRSYVVDGLELLAIDRQLLRSTRGDLKKATLWRAPCGGGTALVVGGGKVYCGTSSTVEVFDAATGRLEQSLPVGNVVTALALDGQGLVATARDGSLHAFVAGTSAAGVRGAGPAPASEPSLAADLRERSRGWVSALASRRGWALWSGEGDPMPTVAALVRESDLHVVIAVRAAVATPLRTRLADLGWLGTRTSVVERRDDGSLPLADHLFNLVLADGLTEVEAARLACPAPSGWIVRDASIRAAPADPTGGSWTHQYGTAANTSASGQVLTGKPRLQWFGGHGPERMPDRHTRGHAPLAAGGILVSMGEDAVVATDARNGTVRWELDLPDSMRYAMPYDIGYAALDPDGRRLRVAVDGELWEVDARRGAVERRVSCPVPGLHWGWVALAPDGGGWILGSAEAPTAPRTVKQFELVDLDYRSERPLVCSKVVFRMDAAAPKPAWLVRTEGLFVNTTFCSDGRRVLAVEALGSAARAATGGRATCAQLLEEARVVCWDAGTGKELWSRPLQWPGAKDILGLGIEGGRLFLSAAESVGQQAVYHLRCWSASDGAPLWEAKATNPVKDLYHGQQVKRPVLMGDRVAFESGLFDAATGKQWVPPGAGPEWILSRPGHACGGMTGAGGGLLFRADNPTFFRLSDGSFTKLSPTRPGCWLNILPVEGGVVIPEASASCVCGYPLQTSMGFVFDRE